ncbi:MAG TPA: response regulator [Desulfuromonadales bacterium]|nr:response regulator [Desulfuromonadales bacterium]
MTKRILIAEDDLMSSEMLATFARGKGYEVVAVLDGVELLTMLAEQQFDVIITDLMMATLDGASATEIMRMLEITTPVIALTALSADEIELVKDKFIKVYQKPCDFNALFECVSLLTGEAA